MKLSPKLRLIAIMAALLLCTAACSNTAAPGPGAADPTPPEAEAAPTQAPAEIDNSKTGIGVLVQEYEGENIVEILKFEGENPELEKLNSEIEAGPLSLYNEYRQSGDWDCVEIRSYPAVDEDFVQIITSCVFYPDTQPELYMRMWSYNFNKSSNSIVTLDDMLDEYGLTKDMVISRVNELFVPRHESETLYSAEITGFFINRIPAKPVVNFLIEIMAETESDPYKYFFMYTTDLDNMSPEGDNDELTLLNPGFLLEPDLYGLATMDPPLAYEWQEPDSSVLLSFDTDGLEILSHYEYSLDGLLYFMTQDFPIVSDDMYDENTLSERIKALEGDGIRILSLGISDEISQILTFPAWVIEYETGSNEDLRVCKDVYFQTDAGEHRLHSSVPSDYADQFRDETERRLLSIELKGVW